MGINLNRAVEVARQKGAAAGQDRNLHLWNMSKRELVEIALHLAALATGEYDDALASNKAGRRVVEEWDALKQNGLL